MSNFRPLYKWKNEETAETKPENRIKAPRTTTTKFQPQQKEQKQQGCKNKKQGASHDSSSTRQCFNVTFKNNVIVPCGKSVSPYPAKTQQQQVQRLYPFLSVCAVFSCVHENHRYGCQCLSFLTYAHVSMQEGCTDSVTESALKADSGEKTNKNKLPHWGLESKWIILSILWCLTSTETVRPIRDGEKGGGGVRRWRKREIIYPSLHCHHQNDSCVKMGSKGRNHKTVSTDHIFWRERRAEADSNRGPSAYHPNALPLGQTDSHRGLEPAPWRFSRTLYQLSYSRAPSSLKETKLNLIAYRPAPSISHAEHDRPTHVFGGEGMELVQIACCEHVAPLQ